MRTIQTSYKASRVQGDDTWPPEGHALRQKPIADLGFTSFRDAPNARVALGMRGAYKGETKLWDVDGARVGMDQAATGRTMKYEVTLIVGVKVRTYPRVYISSSTSCASMSLVLASIRASLCYVCMYTYG